MNFVKKVIKKLVFGVYRISTSHKPSSQLWTNGDTSNLLEQIKSGSVQQINLGLELREPVRQGSQILLNSFECVGPSVVIAVCKALETSKETHQVNTLDFSQNTLNKKAVGEIASLIEQDSTIKTIRLSYCQINEENKKILEKALASNFSLTTLNLKNNLFNTSSPSRSISPVSTPLSGASTPSSTTSSESAKSTGSSEDPSLANIHAYLERNRQLEETAQQNSTKKINNELPAKKDRKKKAGTKTEKKERKKRKRFYRRVRDGKSKKARREWRKLSSKQSKLTAFNSLFKHVQPGSPSEEVIFHLLSIKEISNASFNKEPQPIAKSNASLLKTRREMGLGNYERAIEYANEAIKANSENAMAYLYRGLCHYRLALQKSSSSTGDSRKINKQRFFFNRKKFTQTFNSIPCKSSNAADFSNAYNDFLKAYEAKSLGKHCSSYALAYLLISGKKSGEPDVATFATKVSIKECNQIREILRCERKDGKVILPHPLPIVDSPTPSIPSTATTRPISFY